MGSCSNGSSLGLWFRFKNPRLAGVPARVLEMVIAGAPFLRSAWSFGAISFTGSRGLRGHQRFDLPCRQTLGPTLRFLSRCRVNWITRSFASRGAGQGLSVTLGPDSVFDQVVGYVARGGVDVFGDVLG